MQRGFLIALVALGCTGGDPTAESPSDATRRQEAIRWSNRGSLYLQQGRPARAVAALERATRLDSTTGAAHFNLGLAHARREQPPAAVAAFERARASEGPALIELVIDPEAVLPTTTLAELRTQAQG